jgi:hypothetical protein
MIAMTSGSFATNLPKNSTPCARYSRYLHGDNTTARTMAAFLLKCRQSGKNKLRQLSVPLWNYEPKIAKIRYKHILVKGVCQVHGGPKQCVCFCGGGGGLSIV